ncbi:hypothetical protein [Noviherbaspirillum humi]|nr:hypothetical protein [Noviherbaspirillum humi]
MTNSSITLKSRVDFDSDDGRHTGTVVGLLRDINNGRGIALVEIDHELPGVVHQVAIDQLHVRYPHVA